VPTLDALCGQHLILSELDLRDLGKCFLEIFLAPQDDRMN